MAPLFRDERDCKCFVLFVMKNVIEAFRVDTQLVYLMQMNIQQHSKAALHFIAIVQSHYLFTIRYKIPFETFLC